MSRWQHTTRRKDVPAKPGCYVLYEGARVVYVGSSTNLKARLGLHLRRPRALYRDYGDVVEIHNPITHAKYRVSRCEGDWLMWEWRLITRLQPRDNRSGVDKRA